MTVTIQLNQGYVALIDKEDEPMVAGINWFIKPAPSGIMYVRRNRPGRQAGEILLHRLLLGVKDDEWVDHINGDGLDNRRCNLRKCNPEENARNRRIYRNNTSGVAGVWWNPVNRKWRAYIRVNGRLKSLGHYEDKEEAVVVRKAAEIQFFGEFAAKRV